MIRNDVQRRWEVEARAFADSPEGADWDFQSAVVSSESSQSVAVFRNRRTGVTATVTLSRDTFWNAELRRAEMEQRVAALTAPEH